MNSIYKSIKYVGSEKLFISFEGKIKSCLKIERSFQKGECLFEVESRKLLASYCVSEDLAVKPEKTLDHVVRIEGEYINKGEVIAERTVSAGMLSKRVLSDYDGIVNLSKAKLGYVNILSELGAKSCVANFNGVVKDIDFSKGVFVETDVCEIPLFFSNSFFEENMFGYLQVLSNAESVPSVKKMQKSFEDKVVFVGRFLYPELAKELFKKGCKFILTSSMNYNDMKDLDVPVGVLTGFGNIFFDVNKFDLFKEFDGLQVSVSKENGLVQFPVGLDSNISKLFEQTYYTNSIKVGDIVRSRDLDSFGLIGEVQSFEEQNIVRVLIQDGVEFTIGVENLELYEEDYSFMRTRIF